MVVSYKCVKIILSHHKVKHYFDFLLIIKGSEAGT